MTTWLPWLGVLPLVALVAWRFARRRDPQAGASERQLSLEEVSSAAVDSLHGVRDAVDRCAEARGDDLPVARRELEKVLDEYTTSLQVLVRDARRPRFSRMVQLTTEELWTMAGPWLSLPFVVTRRPAMTTEEAAELQRRMWSRAEELIAACRTARGDDLAVAQARLRAHVDELEASSKALAGSHGGPMSERQAAMWRLAVEEVSGFAELAERISKHCAGEALARKT